MDIHTRGCSRAPLDGEGRTGPRGISFDRGPAAVAKPEADVEDPPPRQTFWDEDRPGGRRIKRVVRVSRPDKIFGLIPAVVIGVPLLLLVLPPPPLHPPRLGRRQDRLDAGGVV